jgi:Tfp pilus assembly protein PilN
MAVALGAGQEMLGQKRDVVDPLAQGRHGDGHAAQAVEQVLPERARLHALHQVGLARWP